MVEDFVAYIRKRIPITWINFNQIINKCISYMFHCRLFLHITISFIFILINFRILITKFCFHPTDNEHYILDLKLIIFILFYSLSLRHCGLFIKLIIPLVVIQHLVTYPEYASSIHIRNKITTKEKLKGVFRMKRHN